MGLRAGRIPRARLVQRFVLAPVLVEPFLPAMNLNTCITAPGRLFKGRRAALLLAPGLLGLAPAASAVAVQFSVDMAEALAYGLLPSGATVGLAGDFNAWQPQAAPLADPDGDGIWAAPHDLAQGNHSYKFVVILPQGDLLWESAIANRTVTVGPTPLDLPLAWWDRLTAPDPPLQPVEVRVGIDLGLPIAQGRFDPLVDSLRLQGNHAFLGNWQLPGPALAVDPLGLAQAWITIPALGGLPVAWKAVIVPGDGSPWIWEDGPDQLLQFSDPDHDQHPAPAGNGIADLELPLRAFGHEAGWQPTDLAWGADLSFTARLEHEGAVWSRNGQPRDPLELFHTRGWSVLRLRLWHSPAEPWHGLDSTLALARRGQALGQRLLLDLHYSDSWADPGQQTPPAAWQGLPVAILADSVRAWTAAVMQRFHLEGLDPEWLQLGNEIDGGLLWPQGDVRAANNTPAQWQNLATLLGAAAEGAWLGVPVDSRPKRVIHLSQSGYTAGVLRFLDELESRSVPFESVGLSYYPWWHGDLQALRGTLLALGNRGDHEILVVETDYPWSLGWADDTGNFVGLEDQLLEGFPASPEGQAAYYRALAALLKDVPGPGVGLVCLWEPAWITTAGFGSVQENLALFDFAGNALPALDLPAPRVPELEIVSPAPGHLRLQWTAEPGIGRWRVLEAMGPGQPFQPLTETSEPFWNTIAPLGTRVYRVVALGPDGE
jgi:arabinogalactan endo-1,4-beta-galactosidase